MNLTLAETAHLLGKSPRHIRYLLKSGHLQGRKVAARWTFDSATLPSGPERLKAKQRKAAELGSAVEEALGRTCDRQTPPSSSPSPSSSSTWQPSWACCAGRSARSTVDGAARQGSAAVCPDHGVDSLAVRAPARAGDPCRAHPARRAAPARRRRLGAQGHGVGLPIGNLTSQWWDNFYLGALDHFACRTLRVPSYQRYMDDITVFGDDRDALLRTRDQLAEWLAKERRLRLKDPNARPLRTDSHMRYLGYTVTRAGVSLGPKARERMRSNLCSAASDSERLRAAVASYASAWLL